MNDVEDEVARRGVTFEMMANKVFWKKKTTDNLKVAQQYARLVPNSQNQF